MLGYTYIYFLGGFNLENNVRKVFSRIGLASAASIIVVYLAYNLLYLLFNIVAPSIVNSTWFIYTLNAVSFYLFGFGVLYLIVKNMPTFKNKVNKNFSIGEICVIVIIAFAFMYISNFITVILAQVISLIFGGGSNPLDSMIDTNNLFLTFIFVGLLAPIMEELMFRKIMLERLKGYGDVISIIVTAVMFGLFHRNFYQFLYATAIGLILAYIALKSGSVKYSILLHVIINTFGSVIAPLLTKMPIIGVAFLGLFLLGVIIAGIVLFSVFFKKIKLSPGMFNIKTGTLFNCAFLNVGMIIYIIICFILSVLVFFGI